MEAELTVLYIAFEDEAAVDEGRIVAFHCEKERAVAFFRHPVMDGADCGQAYSRPYHPTAAERHGISEAEIASPAFQVKGFLRPFAAAV